MAASPSAAPKETGGSGRRSQCKSPIPAKPAEARPSAPRDPERVARSRAATPGDVTARVAGDRQRHDNRTRAAHRVPAHEADGPVVERLVEAFRESVEPGAIERRWKREGQERPRGPCSHGADVGDVDRDALPPHVGGVEPVVEVDALDERVDRHDLAAARRIDDDAVMPGRTRIADGSPRRAQDGPDDVGLVRVVRHGIRAGGDGGDTRRSVARTGDHRPASPGGGGASGTGGTPSIPGGCASSMRSWEHGQDLQLAIDGRSAPNAAPPTTSHPIFALPKDARSFDRVPAPSAIAAPSRRAASYATASTASGGRWKRPS